MIKSINTQKKIAIIGCGYWGSIITNTLLKLGYKKIIIFDINLKNSKILKDKYKILTISKNYNDLLIDKSIEYFFFATPPAMNFDIIKKAIIYKKKIFIEKPGFKKINEFKKIIELSKKNKTFLMFGYVYCYHDYISYIKKLLKDNKLGKLLYIRFQRQNLGPIRSDVNSSYDLSSHDLSIILYIFDKLPKLINHIHYPILKKDISDISNLHMKLNNIYIDINTSWLNPNKVRTITIVGEKKMLFFDELNLNEPLKIYNKYAKYPDMTKFDKKFINSKAQIYLGNLKTIKIKSQPPLKNEITNFFKSIKNNSTSITNEKFAFKIINFLKRIN